MARIDGRLYVAMQSGADYLVPAADAKGRPRFAHITGTNTQCWDFARVPDPDGGGRMPLLLACGDGLMEIQGTAAIPIKAPSDLSFRSNVLLRLHRRSDAYMGGTLRRRCLIPPRRWQMDRRGPDRGITSQVRTLFENPDGSLWAGSQDAGVTLPPRPRALTAPARVPPSPSKSSVTADGLLTRRRRRRQRRRQAPLRRGRHRAALPAVRREDATLRTRNGPGQRRRHRPRCRRHDAAGQQGTIVRERRQGNRRHHAQARRHVGRGQATVLQAGHDAHLVGVSGQRRRRVAAVL